MVLVADTIGQLHFVEATTGHIVFTHSSHHEDGSGYTTSAAFDSIENRPVLVVGGSDGSVTVHKLVLYRDGLPVSGRVKPIPDPDFEEGAEGKCWS